MTVPKTLSGTKTHVSCGSPDCDWGTPMPSFNEGEWDRYRHEFREHCIVRHGWIQGTPNESAGSTWRRLR